MNMRELLNRLSEFDNDSSWFKDNAAVIIEILQRVDRETDGDKFFDNECCHVWVAGMLYVADEDLITVSSRRSVECEECGVLFDESTIQS